MKGTNNKKQSRVIFVTNRKELDLYVLEVKKFLNSKKVMYLLFTDDSDTYNFKYTKYNVLTSWFDDVNSYSDFVKKYYMFNSIVKDVDVEETLFFWPLKNGLYEASKL